MFDEVRQKYRLKNKDGTKCWSDETVRAEDGLKMVENKSHGRQAVKETELWRFTSPRVSGGESFMLHSYRERL